MKSILEKRKSYRKFSNKQIERSELESILWAGTRAPYASGGPRRRIIPIRDLPEKQRLRAACHNQPYVEQCDTVLVVCGTDTETYLKSGFPKYVHDCDAATMCMDLMAVSLGLGTCWIGHFKPEEVRKIIGCNERPTIILLVGYANRD